MNLSQTRIASHGGLLLASCLQWFAFDAEAAPGVWRCGNTYTDTPCHHGKPLEVDDARSNDQKREADKATRDAQAMADRMEQDRRRLESKAGGAVLLDDTAHRPRNSPPPAKSTELQKLKPRKDTLYVNPHDRAPKRSKKKSAKD